MASIVQFSKNMRKRGQQVLQGESRLVKRVAKGILKNLVTMSPADTGRMRSNYRVSVGGTATAVISPYAPGKGLGMGERANANAAYNVGKAKIDAIAGRITKSIKISNNVPYLDIVNSGRVKQTEPFFIERAIELGKREGLKNFKIFPPYNGDELD